ncbi:MAG: hypothetical protein KAT43_00095 [Nanoarchaeota archaeon]|nr:hypothetical protein [Nanoarchaeota archaeon]
MLRMLIELLGGKTEENPSQRTNEDSNRTFDSMEDILSVIEDPVKRIIAGHKVGEDISEEIEELVRDPYEYGAKRIFDKHYYIYMLEELRTAGINIPQESVDFWIQQQHPNELSFGLDKNLAKYAGKEAIHKKGIEVYRFLVEKHEKSQSDNGAGMYFGNYCGDGKESRRERIVASFGLTQEDTIDLDRRAFRNLLAFSVGGDLYKMIYSSTETVEDVLKNSRITKFRELLGLEKEQIIDIIEKYVRTVLNGKSAIRISGYSGDKMRESIENAYGMLLEFGEELGLTEEEEKKLAKKYMATEYAHMPLVEKYFPDEVAKWRQKKQEANEAVQFKCYFKQGRDRLKKRELFESERFVEYDRSCFMEALRSGDFGFAHEIASERDYQELPLLEKLAKE